MTPDLLSIIESAYELIKDPKRWTRRAAARDKTGSPVFPTSDLAVSWCVLGALEKVVDGPLPAYHAAAACLSRFAARLYTTSGLIGMNDLLEHKQILHVFETAIKELQEERGGSCDQVPAV